MRRVSQRQGLVTLSEINITPLLDLAFVLLIIFVITTPLLEQGLDLRLPDGGTPDKPVEKSDIATLEVSPQGIYAFRGTVMRLEEIERRLSSEHRTNPRLVVYVRADAEGAFKHVATILDSCERLGISRISLRTKPSNGPR